MGIRKDLLEQLRNAQRVYDQHLAPLVNDPSFQRSIEEFERFRASGHPEEAMKVFDELKRSGFLEEEEADSATPQAFDYLREQAEKKEPLFEVFEEVRWDENQQQLSIRHRAYYPSPYYGGSDGLKTHAFTSSDFWKTVTQPELKMWQELEAEFPNETERGRQFLMRLNRGTYWLIQTKMDELSGWEAGDARKMSECGENVQERYYQRHLMRNAYKHGADDIENLLAKAGFDVEEELLHVKTKSFPTRESLLSEIKAEDIDRRAHRLREIRMARARRVASGDVNSELSFQRDFELAAQKEREDTDNLISRTLRLLPLKIQEEIEDAAHELKKDLGEFYNSFVRSQESLTREELKSLLSDDIKFKEFFGEKLSSGQLRQFIDNKFKELRATWWNRLSEDATHVRMVLKVKYGKSFELSHNELVAVGHLSKENFQKVEQDEWLPKMRELWEKYDAEKLADISNIISQDDEKEKEEHRSEIVGLNNTIAVQNNLVRKLKRKAAGKPSDERLEELANKNRMKTTSKINYSALAVELGVSNHTARKWCDELRLK